VIAPLLSEGVIRGMAHITGGGLKDNLPRSLPASCIARIDPGSWPSLPVFDYLVERGAVATEERYRVFNMGIGFVIVTRPADAGPILARHPEARHIGEILDRQTTHEAPVQGLAC
jgi:phosphoribosylformylglycinamidine cyclo-ligase